MLHINDIINRLKNNPEPQEVTKMREHIISSFSNLEFIEEGHKYYLHEKDNTIEMTSVSHICHMFEPHVDWNEKAAGVALKEGVDVEVIKRRWKENNLQSTSNGTLTHLFAEAYMWFFMGKPEKMPEIIYKMQYENGFLIPYGEKQKAVASFYKDLYKVNNFYPVMPETQIYIKKEDNPYNINYNISGTFDALFAFKRNNKFYLSIFDWKTNKSLYSEYNQKFNNTLLPPFDSSDFIDQPKSLYTLQLNLYQLGLMQLEYEIADRKLVWLKDDATYEKISVPNITDILKKALY